MNILKQLMLLPALLCWSISVNAAGKPISFTVFGDSGYIPAYEHLDEDERMLTVGEYMAEEVKDHMKKNTTLDGFKPTPMTFEASLGSYMPASGLYPVAWAQQEYCKTRGCDFGMMLGDNIYPNGATLGADGISDARRFKEMFDQPYGKLGAGVPNFTIYSVLGNHDWRTSREAAVAQMKYLDQHPNFYIPNFFYKVSPPGFEGELEIFMLDTEVMLAGVKVYDDELDKNGNEIRSGKLEEPADHIKPKTQAERNMVSWLENELKNSKARWKIVAAHHVLWSGSGTKHEQARALRALILPALCRYADAYFNGHEHSLEVYTDGCASITGALSAPLPALISGAAGKYRPLNPAFMRQQMKNNPKVKNLFSKGQIWGFMHARIEGDTMTVQVLSTPEDLSGRPVLEAEFTFPRRAGKGQ